MSHRPLSHPRRLRLLSGVAAVALVAGTAAGAGVASASGHGITPHVAPALRARASQLRYAVNRPLCATRVKPGAVTCFAMRRVTVKKGIPGARPYVVPSTIGLGPAGGLTPDDLAAAYQFNPQLSRGGQTVGIVDWYDDPHVGADLNVFDQEYGLPKESRQSFRKVELKGSDGQLPSASKGRASAGEIALDVETVRAVCNTCRILLVETSLPYDHDLAVAENTAVRLGATEVSNSFGGPENRESQFTRNGFNHPGVVITASTGDDGWFAWDVGNDGNASDVSSESPEYPSSDPNVVAVGGTALELDSGTGAIVDQTVWNENGLSDANGLNDGIAEGAGGGGCSTEYKANAWQLSATGESNVLCSNKRVAADVSLDADPETGFDIYDSWGNGHPNHKWLTVGGTSLSSPMLAAMWALAGGSGGAMYPSRSLYRNALTNPSLVYDVTQGGNGFCGGDTTANCGNQAYTLSQSITHNPNALSVGDVDCSFTRTPHATDPVTPPPASAECNAVAGFDGPSGVGAPASPSLLVSTSPTASIRRPDFAKLHKPLSFFGQGKAVLAGTTIAGYQFSWGDGQSTSSSTPSAKHTYGKKGHYTVAFYVTDSKGQRSIAKTTVTVGEPLGLELFGTASIKHGHRDRFEAVVSDPNLGGKVTKVVWHWGDGHTSRGAKVAHTWHASGTYRIIVELTDNTGVTSVFSAKEKVT